MGILKDCLIAVAWGITGAISMAVALAIFLRVFSWITPINEWEEIKKGNLSVSVVMGAGILAFAIVIAAMLTPLLK